MLAARCLRADPAWVPSGRPSLASYASFYPAGDAAVGCGPGRTTSPPLTRYTSRQYTIYTNLDREETKEFAAHMDAVFSEYKRRFANFTQHDHKAMDLYLFRTQDQYQQFLAEHDINAANTGGMFFIQEDLRGLATWTADKSRTQTFEVLLQHEGFHQFAFAYIGPDLRLR